MIQNNTGILLTNIGTPDAPNASAVRRYLKEFLSDRFVVEIPRIVWWPILHGFILPTRPQQSAKLYQKIWTEQGSPLLFYSKNIATQLEKKLQIPVVLGMHYGNPSIKNALETLRDRAVAHIFVLPLYPQYSRATTGSSFDRITSVLKNWRSLPSFQMINQYSTNATYIAAIAQSIKDFRAKYGTAPHLLFSFHGIPEQFVRLGDPYPTHCYATARLVADTLKLTDSEWSVSFQSRLGRAKWLTPYTDEVLEELPRQGVKHVQVICPGFATDCLETLEEIAIRGHEQFLEAGGEKFEYISALNDSAEQIEILASLAQTNFLSSPKPSLAVT